MQNWSERSSRVSISTSHARIQCPSRALPWHPRLRLPGRRIRWPLLRSCLWQAGTYQGLQNLQRWALTDINLLLQLTGCPVREQLRSIMLSVVHRHHHQRRQQRQRQRPDFRQRSIQLQFKVLQRGPNPLKRGSPSKQNPVCRPLQELRRHLEEFQQCPRLLSGPRAERQQLQCHRLLLRLRVRGPPGRSSLQQRHPHRRKASSLRKWQVLSPWTCQMMRSESAPRIPIVPMK
mmetsp:Transcript_59008/g.108167  ORF Transcript_59008/g.108167 Transcript_59008/m.108167 type:complete len:233 (-) Transcript_59008:83-781(-)